MTISTHANVRTSRFGRLGALGAGVAVALAGILLPTAASAATNTLPDDSNLTVAPVGHVDSPKTYFENGEFVLKGHFGRGNDVPLDTALHHLGKSYLGSRNMYVFTVPENAPELDFLGQAGDNWYMGYFGSEVSRIAIWAGFGAESDIPVEEFRDATFTLDLVSVDGPGRVELFTWAEAFDEDEAGTLSRMFSSTDPAFRSFFLVPGSHTHNYTLFSAPGRYNLKYRATARKADGTLLASRESVARWQVGGARPPSAGVSTSSTRTATAPTLSVGPATGANEPDALVIPKLDRLRVDMGADVAGTATFLINGYKLADVALSSGVAEMVDLLGNAENEIQVQVRGTDGQVLFTSDSVSYEHGGQAATTTATAEELVDKSPAPSQSFPVAEVTAAAAPVVNITLAPGERGTLKGTFSVSDPTALGKVQVAAYSKSTDKTWQVDMNFLAGGKTGPFVGQITDGNFYEDHYVVARFIPHPFMTNLRKSEVIVTEALDPTATTTATLTVVRDQEPEPEPSESASVSATPTPEVSVSTTPTPEVSVSATPTPEVSVSASATASAEPTTSASAEPTPTPSVDPVVPAPVVEQCPPGAPQSDEGKEFEFYGERIAIEDGHIDFAAVEVGDKLALRVKDDSRTAANATVFRPACHVAVIVPAAAKLQRSPAGNGWDAVLPTDGTFGWLLPSLQRPGLPWPGYSTENLDFAKFGDDLKLDLISVEGPGEVSLLNYDAVERKVDVLLGNREGAPRTLEIDGSVHAHPAWAFTKAGEYKVGLRYRGTTKAGAKLTGQVGEVVFVVKDRTAPSASAVPTVTAVPTVSATPTVSAAPSVTPAPTVTAVPSVSAVPTVAPSVSPSVVPSPSVSVKPTLPPVAVVRAGGVDRVDTAVKVAELVPVASDVAVLATGVNWPDALASAPLARALQAPLFLTGGKVLESNVAQALAKRGVKRVVIVGGTKSVSAGVANALTRAGLKVERVEGKDRFATSVEVAKEVQKIDPSVERVFVATGLNYPDALAAGSVSGPAKSLTVLSNGTKLPAQVAAYLKSSKLRVEVVGGAPAAGLAQAGIKVAAIHKGADRYASAVEVAKAFASPGSAVVVSSGQGFADALGGAALAANTDGVLVLTRAASLPAKVAELFAKIGRPASLTITGGPATINPVVASELAKLTR